MGDGEAWRVLGRVVADLGQLHDADEHQAARDQREQAELLLLLPQP